MTKRELLELYSGLHSVGDLSGTRFSYNVAKNISILRPEAESLEKAKQPSPEYMEYDQERVELAKKYAVKMDGQPVIVDEQYQIADQDAFNKEWDKLKKKYKKALDDRKAQAEEFNAIIEEEVEPGIELWSVSIDDVPEGITAAQMSALLPMIKDGSEKEKETEK